MRRGRISQRARCRIFGIRGVHGEAAAQRRFAMNDANLGDSVLEGDHSIDLRLFVGQTADMAPPHRREDGRFGGFC